MPEAKRILVVAPTANAAEPLRAAADKLALEVVLGCSDDTGTIRLNFSTRDSALHIIDFVRENPVAAIVPVGDETTPSAARAASMAGIPFHAPKAADACANKIVLCRKLAGAGLKAAPGGAATDLTIECAMSVGKLRVLAAVRESFSFPFRDLPAATQQNAVEILRKLTQVLMLKHGPVHVEFTETGAIRDVSLCYLPQKTSKLLHFRIPLVDQDVTYEEVVIRNLLDLDISRVLLDSN